MRKKGRFNIEEGKAFVVTTDSSNVEALKNASEKYGVEIPNARYIIICGNEKFEYYYELEGYGITEFAFAIPVAMDNQMLGLPAGHKDENRLKEYAVAELEGNLDNMDWDKILTQYLAEEGIEYEEGYMQVMMLKEWDVRSCPAENRL